MEHQGTGSCWVCAAAHLGKLQTSPVGYSSSRPELFVWPFLTLPAPVPVVMLVWMSMPLICLLFRCSHGGDWCSDNIQMNAFRGHLFWTALNVVLDLRSIEILSLSIWSEQWLECFFSFHLFKDYLTSLHRIPFLFSWISIQTKNSRKLKVFHNNLGLNIFAINILCFLLFRCSSCWTREAFYPEVTSVLCPLWLCFRSTKWPKVEGSKTSCFKWDGGIYHP